MSKGKYKNKKKNSIKDDTTNVSIQKKKQSNQKKQYLKQKSKQATYSHSNSNTSKKFKLHVMDVITIVFTAVIIGIMIFVVYNQFVDNSSSNKPSQNITSLQSEPVQSSAPATATPKPTLSDVGNIYGNITNDASSVIKDQREYFISADNNGNSHIFANVDGKTKDLIQTNCSSLSVVNDYLSYTDQADVTSYYVFYINGDGNICYVKDGPIGTQLEEPSNLKEEIFVEGNFVSIDVSGEYVYHLSSEGDIGRTSITEKTHTKLSSKNNYSDFVLYYGYIYARGADDGLIYSFSVDSSKAIDEKCIVSTPCNKFVVDNNYIYTITNDTLYRYSVSGIDLKETLLKAKADSINVYKDSIFYISSGSLYTCSALSLLNNETPTKICDTVSNTINVSSDSVYLKAKNNKLLKSTFDKNSSTYSKLTEMN